MVPPSRKLLNIIRLKRPVFTEASAHLYLQLYRPAVEIEKIRLSAHHSIGKSPVSAPHNTRIPVKCMEISEIITLPKFKVPILRAEHKPDQAVRRGKILLPCQVKNKIAHCKKFRDIIFLSHSQVFHIVIRRVDQQILVKTCGIRRKYTAVRLDIGKHHAKIAQNMLLIGGIPRNLR